MAFIIEKCNFYFQKQFEKGKKMSRDTLINPFLHVLFDDTVTTPLEQACQTQTTLQATKATKTTEGAAKVLKNSLVGYI